MFKSKKFRIIGISALVILIVALLVAKKQGWLGQEEETKVAVEKVAVRNVTESITANGKIQPEKELIIAPDASGEIVGLYIKEGDSVKKGDLLMKINPDIYISTLDRAVASLNSSKANLANSTARKAQTEAQFVKAKYDYERNKNLFNQKVISASEFETIEANFQVAKAELVAAEESVKAAQFAVKNAEASVKESQDNLTKTSVFAPIDGTISKLSKELGERVAGASQFSGGTEVLRIANLNNMEARVDVSENDIVRVKLGDTALIEVDAYLDRKFKGIVTQIANSSNTSTSISTDQVTNFTVRIRILPESYADLQSKLAANQSPFRPGMSASVEILTNYKAKVLTVPITAVTTRDDTLSGKVGSRKAAETETFGEDKAVKEKKNESKANEEMVDEYVFVLSKNEAVLRKVKIGIQDDTYFEIVEGLKEGETVITAPYKEVSQKLKNHTKVKVVEKEKLFEEK